ncbi:hypothetical protein EDB84DRAFT_402742 [Lactarius hengduanensis]|nr:hypothetical protein EDB84DRAFT_402742 [Lactarius hengduanensis]
MDKDSKNHSRAPYLICALHHELLPNQYGTQQTSAQNVPQQQQQRRQSASQPRYQTSTSAQVSSRSEYPEQITVYPSYNDGAPQAQQAYLDPYGAGYATGNPAFPEPHSSPPAVLTSNAAPLGSQQLNTPPPAVPSNAPPDNQQVITLPPAVPYNAPTPDSQQRFTLPQVVLSNTANRTAGDSLPFRQQCCPTQLHWTVDSLLPSHSGIRLDQYLVSGPQPTSHYAVPHGHGTNASDGSRSSNHLYQTAAPVTRVAPDPLYRGTQPQGGVAQPQYRDADEYDDVDEHRPKSPGRGPVQGRQYNCRLPECNRPMFFDRHFNEFWEWCSPQHIHAGLGRRIEKTCRHCGVWPRKYGHKYCGGPSCNKNGVPIPSY